MNFPLTKGRVALYPLSAAELQLYIRQEPELYRQLQLHYLPLELNADPSFLLQLDSALRDFLLPAVTNHPEAWPWNAHWLILHQTAQKCIGGLGLSGQPDASGTVYLGYFIHRDYEGQGLMTEALQLLLEWLQTQPACKRITADTPVWHIASARVLAKNGFRILHETAELQHWELLL